MHEPLQLLQPSHELREEFLAFRREFPQDAEIPGLASMKTGDFEVDV